MKNFCDEMLKFFKALEMVESQDDRLPYEKSMRNRGVFELGHVQAMFAKWYKGEKTGIPLIDKDLCRQGWRNNDPRMVKPGEKGFPIGNRAGLEAIFSKAVTAVRPYLYLGQWVREFDVEQARYFSRYLDYDVDSPDMGYTVPFVEGASVVDVEKPMMPMNRTEGILRSVFDPSSLIRNVSEALKNGGPKQNELLKSSAKTGPELAKEFLALNNYTEQSIEELRVKDPENKDVKVYDRLIRKKLKSDNKVEEQ